MYFATRAIRVGQDPDPVTGAVVVPVYQTVNYVFTGLDEHRGYDYTRTCNPTRAALESCLASLEEADFGLAFSSGSAATDAALSILRPGDHVVSARAIYGGTYRILEDLYRPRGVEVTYVEGLSREGFAEAITARTKIVWVETPTNPLLEIADLRALAQVAHSAGALLMVDNTFASPYFQRPLTLGADVVVHSSTKYIGGHSDVLGGALLTSNPTLHAAYAHYQNAQGAVPGPWDTWLLLRGLKTLAVRMREHERNARAVAEFLESHPAVQNVAYPGLASHPGHEIAKAQMDGFGAIVSFRLPGGADAVRAFIAGLQVFLYAESLGGVESLVCHPASMSHAVVSPEDRLRMGITDGTVRLSVGIEDSRDLIADLERALARAAR